MSLPSNDNRNKVFRRHEDLWNLIDEKNLQALSQYYELRGVVGQGGYADIWVARDLRLKRTVAIKSLHEDMLANDVARNAFLTEARMMAYLEHPGVVPLYDFFTDERGRFHIVEKLVMGRTLDDVLRQTREEYDGMQPRKIQAAEKKRLFERLEIFLKVCDTMAYAHYKRILHRDLKMANIMLGAYNEVYVMDWGISELHEGDEPLQATEEMSGTVRYLAPEIMLRRPYDERSDIYSLGVILFELTYMHAAFMQDDDKEVCHCAVHGYTSERKHSYGCKVPPWLARIIYRAMFTDPARRYESVEAMAADIRKGMRGGDGWLVRFMRFIGL